jgi:hypothetical protein
MLLPIVMLSACAIGGAAVFIFLKFQKGSIKIDGKLSRKNSQ